MACPYFYPIRQPLPPLEAMPLPLGDAWHGICRAQMTGEDACASATLVSFCHLGYARGRCAHFPHNDSGADAVRFTVHREGSAEIDLHYVLERDHHPFSHGTLRYSLSVGRFVEHTAKTGREACPTDNLLPQAEAYVASYLRRQK